MINLLLVIRFLHLCSLSFVALKQTVGHLANIKGAEETNLFYSFPGLVLVPDLAPGPDPAGAATALAPAAAATAGMSAQSHRHIKYWEEMLFLLG